MKKEKDPTLEQIKKLGYQVPSTKEDMSGKKYRLLICHRALCEIWVFNKKGYWMAVNKKGLEVYKNIPSEFGIGIGFVYLTNMKVTRVIDIE